LEGCTVLTVYCGLLLLQISENLKDCEARQLAAKDTVEKAEEKLLPVQVGLITDLYFLC